MPSGPRTPSVISGRWSTFLREVPWELLRIVTAVLLTLCVVYPFISREPRCRTPDFLQSIPSANSYSLDLLCQFLPPGNDSKVTLHSPLKCEDSYFDAVVVSPGGVGSSTLFGNLSRVGLNHLNSDVDSDHLKHGMYAIDMQRLDALIEEGVIPPGQCATRMFIYAFDSAAAGVFSLYRRNFHNAHNQKLNKRAYPAICYPQQVENYARARIDYMNLEQHFMTWLMGGLCHSNVPVVFLRSSFRTYEDVFQAVSESLLDIYSSGSELDVDTLTPQLKPLEVQDSHYLTEKNTSKTFELLQRFYADFQQNLDGLGYLTVVFKRKYRRLV